MDQPEGILTPALFLAMAIGPILWWGARRTARQWETEDGVSKKATLIADVLSFALSPCAGCLLAVSGIVTASPIGSGLMATLGWFLAPLLWPIIRRRIGPKK